MNSYFIKIRPISKPFDRNLKRTNPQPYIKYLILLLTLTLLQNFTKTADPAACATFQNILLGDPTVYAWGTGPKSSVTPTTDSTKFNVAHATNTWGEWTLFGYFKFDYPTGVGAPSGNQSYWAFNVSAKDTGGTARSHGFLITTTTSNVVKAQFQNTGSSNGLKVNSN